MVCYMEQESLARYNSVAFTSATKNFRCMSGVILALYGNVTSDRSFWSCLFSLEED